MPYCRKCGSLQCDDFVFCTECGVKRVDPEREETVANGETTANAEKALPNVPVQPQAVAVDYSTQNTDTAEAVQSLPQKGSIGLKIMCALFMAATLFVQFMPFYKLETFFSDYELNVFQLLEGLMESEAGGGETQAMFTAILLLSIFAMIGLFAAMIYFLITDGIGFAITSLVFSALVQSFLPFTMSDGNMFFELTVTGIFYVYLILTVISVVSLICFGSTKKEG